MNIAIALYVSAKEILDECELIFLYFIRTSHENNLNFVNIMQPLIKSRNSPHTLLSSGECIRLEPYLIQQGYKEIETNNIWLTEKTLKLIFVQL